MPEQALALRGAFMARPVLPKALAQSATAWTLAAPAVVLMALMIAVIMLDSLLWSQSRFHINILTLKIQRQPTNLNCK